MESMPLNPAAEVDEQGFAVRRTIRIDAPLTTVWRAVTEPALVSRWFAETVLVDRSPGGTGSMTFGDEPPIPFRLEESDPPHRVSYRWNNDGSRGAVPAQLSEATSTVFTFTLAAEGDGTRLTVVETGFAVAADPIAEAHHHADGWTRQLDKLVAFAESAA